ncbi:DNA-directed RNA polymerase subunit beta [Nocardia puris]|uniref:DNA-directed RNA polymerase subunit beta n=1 Tax=Nocardia puris TaxID=208602 RepID=UPI001894A4CB|nr:DNA-directed RNA polymerase subunit beta [Nocardia puris]MBF6216201.1 DNA-directed RNA polymerase subunit beta [Nocardia puris]
MTGTSDTPVSRCRYYRTVCGLPAAVRDGTGRISFTTNLVWAISMPADVGHAVKLDLERRQRDGGPIISHPRSHTWTMLVRSDIPLREVPDIAQLRRFGVQVLRRGHEIVLPSPTDRGAQVRAWITAPCSTFRPSGMVALESVRMALASRRGTPCPR